MPVSCTFIDRWNETAEHLLGKEMSENWYAANVKTCPGRIYPIKSNQIKFTSLNTSNILYSSEGLP